MKKIVFYLVVLVLPLVSARSEEITNDVVPPDDLIPVMPDVDQTAQLLGHVEQEQLHRTFQKLRDNNDGNLADEIPVSIDFSNPNDLNWEGVLGVSGTDNGPDPIVLPFLPSVPIENLEVKFRVLNKKF